MRFSTLTFAVAFVALGPYILAMFMTLLAKPKPNEVINPNLIPNHATIALLFTASAIARYLGW